MVFSSVKLFVGFLRSKINTANFNYRINYNVNGTIHKQFIYWHVNLHANYFSSENYDLDTQLNCRNIVELKHLVYARYIINNNNEGVRLHGIPNSILTLNEDLFCEYTSQQIITFLSTHSHYCHVIYSNDFCWSVTLIFIPCDLILDRAGFLCVTDSWRNQEQGPSFNYAYTKEAHIKKYPFFHNRTLNGNLYSGVHAAFYLWN